MAEEESLARGRSKRSTAGNRMEAALLELEAADELQKDGEDDVDFFVEKDEEDVFESDFASTDEEAEQQDAGAGEQAAQEEENRERRSARTRVERATAAAHARQAVTFNPTAAPSASPQKNVSSGRPKRRVSLGVATNAETGEVLAPAGTGKGRGGKGKGKAGAGQRHSRRRHTVLNTSATVERLRDAESRRASVPKRARTESKTYTQAELLVRALDTEAGNVQEHRDYLRLEEERRRRARVVRPSVQGPVVRWVSRAEEVKVEPEALYPQPPGPLALTFLSPAPPPPAEPRTEKVTRNYVLHEQSQTPGAPRPSWTQTMEALFGTHVKWDELQVYVGKGRPLGRPREMCPLTGLPAPYRDPRTGVPFANAQAYATLTRVLEHAYVWSDEGGCYVTRPPDGEVEGGVAMDVS